MEHEILVEISGLLEKTGLEGVMPLDSSVSASQEQLLETTLVNVKNLNARYEKIDALNQVQWLMDRYNIQIDELMERIGS